MDNVKDTLASEAGEKCVSYRYITGKWFAILLQDVLKVIKLLTANVTL